jgi:CPA1 family monovalent cation:H+ antiporter
MLSGLMLVSLIFVHNTNSRYYFPKESIAIKMDNINFILLLEGMLSFMLFAGAIHIKFKDLNNENSVFYFSQPFSV